VLESQQHAFVDFKVKSQASGKPIQVHQAFVRISNPSNKQQEAVFIAKYTQKQYSVHLVQDDLVEAFAGQSGVYDVDLIVGDSFVHNPFSWKIAKINVKFPADLKVHKSDDPFTTKKDIVHQFRKEEVRPPQSISMAFTGAVLAPSLIFLIGLLAIGANLKNFPSGSNAIFALGFQTVLGAILALYGFYWLKLNMMQTLLYLGALLIPFLFFAHRTLNHLASFSKSSRGKSD